MPRHPPNALLTLDRSHCQCPSHLSGLADLVRSLALAGCQTGPASTFVETPKGPYPCKDKNPSKNPVAFYNQVMSDVIDVFGPCLLDKRAGVRQAWVLKTSFSRSVRWRAVRQRQSDQLPERANPKPKDGPSDRTSYLAPHPRPISSRLGNQRDSNGSGLERHCQNSSTWKPPDKIFSSRCIRTGA